MKIRCCMVGCDKTSPKDENNEKRAFYVFPKDFNLCMLWVQNCGRPQYFEDFAFAGAQPFLNRHVCSNHFNDSDFVKQNPKLGLLPGTVPKLNLIYQRVEVKEEIIDPEYSESGPLYSESEFNDLKLEKIGNCREANGNLSFSSTDDISDSCNDAHASKLSIHSVDVYKETKEDKELSNEFFKKYETAIRRRGNSKRSYETEEERTLRLKREALRAKIRRSQESEEQRKLRRMKNALRAAFRRRNETPLQRELRKKKDKLRSQRRRKAETEAETRIRKYNDAMRAALRRNNETEEQKVERKMKDIVRAAKRRSLETPEQRGERLRKDRERASKRRMFKKITEQMCRLHYGLSDLDQIVAPTKDNFENGSSPLNMTSIGTIATQCNESSNIDHLQQVLEFIENNTNKSNKKTLKEPPDNKEYRKNEPVINTSHYENSKKLLDYQLTDIFLPKTSENRETNHGGNLKCDRSRNSDVRNILQPEVLWV